MTLLLSIFFICFGAILASFAGVISERLYTGDSWTRGRSHCNSCNRELSVLDLVPVFSWVLSHGACRSCKAPVPYRYALSEVLLAFAFLGAYLTLGLTVCLFLFLVSLFLLTVVVLYDLAHTIVPLPLALLLVVTSGLFALLSAQDIQALGIIALVAGAVGVAFLLLHVLSRGRAMGLGDAPVALALSLLVGTEAIAGLLFSFWIGGFIGLYILVTTPRGHRIGIEVPFVPFLAAGYLLAFFTQWNPLPF